MSSSVNRFPAEWETHAATWLTYPHNRDTWPSNLRQAQLEFEAFARTVSEVENVNILATGDLAQHLRRRFRSDLRISIYEIPSNDSWIRDYGPTFIKSTSDSIVRGIDWVFNGWGEKYPPYDSDQKAAARILDAIEIERIRSSLILEGGSIESNGQSICLTTRLCQTVRNPSLAIEQIKQELSAQLGLKHVLFLDSEIINGDDTDGHIDQVARFVSANQVVVSARQWEHVKPGLVDCELELIRLPDPGPVKVFDDVLPTSYTNFYIANEIVVVPEFGDPTDEPVQRQLKELFPGHQVIGLPSRNLSVGLGSFHCLSQQQPA